MSNNEIPPIEPLAPIVDQMREIAQDELPAPRTCRVKLWDDGTFDAYIFNSGPDDERHRIKYERTTGEIIWEYSKGAGWESEELSGGETLHVPVHDELDVRTITTVEPPYR